MVVGRGVQSGFMISGHGEPGMLKDRVNILDKAIESPILLYERAFPRLANLSFRGI